MAYFRSLHSHLQVLSNKDLKGTRIEHGFKRAFLVKMMRISQVRCSSTWINYKKQLDKDEFQEDGSMAAFWVLNRQLQQFIDSWYTLDYDNQMTDKYFAEYIESKVNKRQMQTQESKFDLGKALDVGLVVTKSSGTESGKHNTSSRSENDTDTDDMDIKHIYDEEPVAEIQLTAECNVFATGQQHPEQPEFNNEGMVDQDAEECQVKSPMLNPSLDNKTTEFLNKSLESENIWQHGQFLNVKSNESKIKHDIDVIETINIELEHSVAKLLTKNEHLKHTYKDLYDSIKKTRDKVFAIAALKNELRKLKGNSVDTKFAKLSVLGKPTLQPLRNQSVVRQPTAFKSERTKISKPWFASQVDVKKDFPKPVTQYYLPKERESAFAKPHHVIASSESRNSSKNMPRFSSNDMVHNHYLDEARKKTQERDRNSKTTVMPSARFQSTADGSKPKLRSTNQTNRNWPTSKSSCVTITAVPKTDHSRNTSSFFTPNTLFARLVRSVSLMQIMMLV
ncbi:hypothetical protein Tco_0653049 [Tanacetum coccineum]|uniref:Uncharacterized protein n=1 Tax=Tanacetum coccineum TaxID=301880 RepID=A0ABQ4WZS7_9ASTR